MKPTHFLTTVLAFSTLTSAWPWPRSIQDIKAIAQENGLYQKRQDNPGGGTGGGNNQGGGGNNAPPPSSSAASSGSVPPQSSSGSDQPSSTGDATNSNSDSNASSSGTDAPPNSDNANSTSSAASTQYTDAIGPNAQPGGVNMILPNTMSAATQYYKVDQTITWIWNYTSLSRPPDFIDVVATVSGAASMAAPSPFTLAQNYSFAPTETFTWDTGKYVNETSALPGGMYTLMIYDAGASGGVSATASGGYLAAYNQFRFGMYTGQPSTALPVPYMCSTCNSANGRMEKEVIWTVLGMAGLTVASFCWFAGGWGLL